MGSTVKIRFAQALQDHDIGHVFYEPPSAAIKVGDAGYLDHSGSWTPLFDVTDSGKMGSLGLKPVPAAQVRKAEPDKCVWGPKISSSVRSNKIDLSTGISGVALGIPAEASVAYAFSNAGSQGAMLLTYPGVRINRLYDEQAFVDWAKQNASKLFELCKDTKTQGFYIVTSTYAASRCATVAWSEQESTIAIGFSVDVLSQGKFAESSEWYSKGSTAGVNEYSAKDGDEKTVSFGGIYFKVRTIRFKGHEVSVKQQRDWNSRGKAGPCSFDVDGFEIEVEYVGKPEAELPVEEEGPEQDGDDF